MSVEQYRREVERHQDSVRKLQAEKAREVSYAASERKKAGDARAGAARTSSVSTARTKLKDAERYDSKAVSHDRRIADIEGKIARASKQQYDAQVKLGNAEKQAAQKLSRERKQQEQADARARSEVNGRLSEHDRLHRAAFRSIQDLQALPATIGVLFLAANPLDQQQLRLDEEVRAIGEMIRKSEHRDSVKLESRWAVRPLDILQALNEFKPRVVHFSGHGSEDGDLVLQDGSGNAKMVSKEAIVQTMMTAADDIQLVFFNTCYSRDQAEAVVAHVPAAIGMNTAVGDDAARVFAAQFYSAIGFGLSVATAFAQAKAALLLEGILEDDVPELFIAEGIDPAELVLVKP
ncbi:CHAT domain-containing protein [Lysobacter enzymogenes]|uniref:CHAT domain-containing protein n=1 Tax=Lysobacter enzymogenes TaxID=69 RepID=UPI00089C05EC|nr:CHAT domain-containing protein [Lysobacter enzymogenes]SDW85113.1 CHAT domain-containing protein [Lysobacter enzymogenes]